ncbi:MAG: zinc metallopeptidase [Lachnospiraceae bacterium]|nr:zinc metallopeptidase [Lachnospiraceae bacterium]
MFYYDPTYIFVIIGALICLAANGYVKSTMNKFSGYRSMSGLTGAEVAGKILRANGISDVSITHIGGDMTDNFNPMKKTVNLSDTSYASNSVAAIAIAAHECGHAVQHDKGYVPMKLRALILPVANIGSMLGLPMVILGVILGGAFQYSAGDFSSQGASNIGTLLCTVGIWVFAAAVAFQIITLPVEFNASSRALRNLEDLGILDGIEINYGTKILRACALTYVAAAASSILQLLRLVLIAGGGKKRR